MENNEMERSDHDQLCQAYKLIRATRRRTNHNLRRPTHCAYISNVLNNTVLIQNYFRVCASMNTCVRVHMNKTDRQIPCFTHAHRMRRNFMFKLRFQKCVFEENQFRSHMYYIKVQFRCGIPKEVILQLGEENNIIILQGNSKQIAKKKIVCSIRLF